MSNLMEKLALSKAIMDRAEGIKNGTVHSQSQPQNMIQDFDIPQAKYNIPQEFLQESPQQRQPQQPLFSLPPDRQMPAPTVDAIKNSKLPDEIKRLMIENPISQPQQQQSVTLSNDLIDRATRLMKETTGNNYVPDSVKPKVQPQQSQPQQTNVAAIDYKLIQKMINEAVTKALKEGGLIAESSEKANEAFSFRVGQHIFEGKVTKIKKIS